jgi:hypothetical protein
MSNVIAKPPPVLASAHVLEYAIVDGSVAYTGKSTLYVDGTAISAVPCLAICRNLHDEQIHLFHCDEAWGVLGASGGDTIEETKRQAESAYRGISARWQPSGYTLEEAQQFQHDLFAGVMCSFCGKRPEQIRSLIRSPHAAICNECVAQFAAGMRNDGHVV